MNENRRPSPLLSGSLLGALLLSASLGGGAQAQGTVLNPSLLQNIQLQPVQLSGIQLNVLRVDQATLNQVLAAPNALPLDLNTLPAQLQAKSALISRSLSLTNSLVNVPDLRADIARATLQLPSGLTVPFTARLRGGASQPVLLYGRDTVALSVANAEANAPRNRAEILRSFGLSEDAPIPREFQAEGATRPVVAPNVTLRLPTQANPQIAVNPLVPLQNAVPKADPSQPGKELGDGFSGPFSDGACRFTPTSPLFSQMRGTNINFITTIKNQAARGTCGAFAFTSGLESLIARKVGTRFNLSEQYAYYWLRGDDQTLGDGVGWGDYDDVIAKKRLLPTEVRWPYNPSWKRVRVPSDEDKPITQFTNSCDDYKYACSNTTAQPKVVCAIGVLMCAQLPNWEITDGSLFDFRPTQGSEVWYSLGSLPFKDAEAGRAYRRQIMRTMLNRGDQLLLGFNVDGAFDSVGADGLPDTGKMGQNYRGGHLVHLIGYVNTGKKTYQNVTLGVGPVNVNLGSYTFDTGYWVVKNSWGCGFGDGGYAYLPDDFLDREANGVYNLRAGAVASDMPGF